MPKPERSHGPPECRFPPCPQAPVAGGDVCYYHSKVRDGLIAPDPHTAAGIWTGARLGSRGPRRGVAKRRETTIGAADVLTDEQTELVRMLEAMGTPPALIRRALAKDPHRQTTIGTKGTGVVVVKVSDDRARAVVARIHGPK